MCVEEKERESIAIQVKTMKLTLLCWCACNICPDLRRHKPRLLSLHVDELTAVTSDHVLTLLHCSLLV